MMEAMWHHRNGVTHRRLVFAGTGVRQSSLLQRLAMISVAGMFVLLPVQAVDLPLNMAPVDLWNVIGSPLVWMYLLWTQRAVRFPYIGGMWLILLGSLISMLWAWDVSTASVVVLKEVYLYIWFAGVAMLLAGADARDLRRILLVWTATVVLHATIVIAEFLSPDIWRALAAFFGPLGKVEVIRPAGLFDNANGAAFFQLMGFVPLVLCYGSSGRAAVLGIVLILSIIGTGSLGATAGLLAGTVVAAVAMAVAGGERRSLYKTVVGLLVIGALLWGLYAFIADRAPDYESRLAYYFYGRAERSAEGRFALWQSGLPTLFSETALWGVGPGNFTDPLSGKTLHNDLLVFALERGFLGVLGVLLVGGVATCKAVRVLTTSARLVPPLAGVIFLAAVVGALVESQFHQVFHERAFWLVLALQEAVLLRTIAVRRALAPKVA